MSTAWGRFANIRFLVLVLSTLVFIPPAFSQQQSSSTQPDPSSSTTPPSQPVDTNNKDEKAKDGDQAGSKDRLFFALPNFLTVENADQVPPISSGEKFKIVARGTFDYIQIPWYGAIAGISQARNSDAGYGQGAAGYGKRYGAAAANGTIENFMTSAIFPSVLHQDPRYFQMGKGGFWHRAEYAATRILITRGDSGNHEFNFSEVLGAGVTGGISNLYAPADERTATNTVETWTAQMGLDAATYVIKEFWPDIRRKILRKKD
jgi:hypothetical protein